MKFDSRFGKYARKLNVVVAIEHQMLKEKIIEKYNPNLRFPTLIHPSVLIGTEFYCKDV
jgi:hypothetical protein